MQRIEVFNELMNIFICIQFLGLLNITDGLTLTQYGLYLNYSIISLFAINLLFVLFFTAVTVFNTCRNKFIRARLSNSGHLKAEEEIRRRRLESVVQSVGEMVFWRKVGRSGGAGSRGERKEKREKRKA